MEVIDSSTKVDQESIEKEGEKQLGGIRILLSFFIAFLSLGYLAVLISSFSTMAEEGFLSGYFILIFGTILYGALSLLYIFPLIGIKKRKPYAIPLIRTVLILYCFNLVGLILVLSIFWRRINNPYTKMYLNYFDGSFEILNNKSSGKIIKEETIISDKYCYYCGEKNLTEAIFCKKCGKKQEKDL